MVARPGKSATSQLAKRRRKDLNGSSVLRGADHRLQPLDHAGLHENAGHIGCQRHVGHPGEGLALQVRQPSRAPGLFRLHVVLVCRHTAALRIAFDECDEALLEEPAMLAAQAPACHRVALHALAQAPVEQDAAGIEVQAAYQAEVLFQRNV